MKKVIKRLEDDGILQGSRARRPGYDIRALTIADTFPARKELIALLHYLATLWPDIIDNVNHEMNCLIPKTKAHLRNRGMWDEQGAIRNRDGIRR